MASKTSKSSSVPPRLPPVKLRDYDTTEKLGEGSYGVVYKAHGKTGAREVVAVKCVLKSELSKAETDNLVTEIAMLKKLKHDNIVHLIDFCWDSNYIYIITEYCGGGDLSKFIKRRTSLSEDVCRRFLRQLAVALKFLRDEDIAHMDLKPSNVLLTAGRKPRLKLADFGLAQKFQNDEEKSSVRGSYLYMAPEMLLKRKYDPRVDLWSLGVILYECLFGKAPYKSETMEELFKKVREEKPIVVPRNNGLSEQCYDLLIRCLERDPDKRITFEEFFQHPFLDLEHFPSESSAQKAAALATKAVAKDNEGDIGTALGLYKEALEYYAPLFQEETNASRKDALRGRIEQYVRRAEEIKSFLKPSSSPNSPIVASITPEVRLEKRNSTENTRFEDLSKMCAMTPKLMTGLEIGRAAEEYELEGRFQASLDKYTSALGILLPLLGAEPSGERKKALGVEVNRWMNRAECVKQFIQTQEKVLADSKMLAEDPFEGCAQADTDRPSLSCQSNVSDDKTLSCQCQCFRCVVLKFEKRFGSRK